MRAGLWATTTFILAYDDWGGYADHVPTPIVETVPDMLHHDGFTIIGGSRLPLVMFGGQVRKAIDNTWHSNASVPKTIIDLFGLPTFGVARVDSAPSLAGFVNTSRRRQPPAFGTRIIQPKPPSPRPKPIPPPAWRGPTNRPLADLVLNGGKTLAAPHDAVVRKTPPKLPKQAPA